MGKSKIINLYEKETALNFAGYIITEEYLFYLS